jgi:hypothetical protein
LSFFDASVSIISSSFHLVSIQIVFFFFFVSLSFARASDVAEENIHRRAQHLFSPANSSSDGPMRIDRIDGSVCVCVCRSSLLLNKQDYFHKCLHPNDNFIFALHVSTNNYN